ncbi:MAG: hypothetical protein EZS28_050612, partial [Streblomastix strix]
MKIFLGWDDECLITVEYEEEYDPLNNELILIKKKKLKIPFVGVFESESYDILYDYETHFFVSTEELILFDCSDVTGKSIQECPCPTDPNLLTQDLRYNTTYKPKEVIQQPPSEEEPEIILPVITVELNTSVNVEDHKNEEANVVENGIQQALNEGKSLCVNVTKNEVYEETNINVDQDKAYILQPKEQTSADLQTPPILRPIEQRSKRSEIPQQIIDPFISVKGNGVIEIK